MSPRPVLDLSLLQLRPFEPVFASPDERLSGLSPTFAGMPLGRREHDPPILQIHLQDISSGDM